MAPTLFPARFRQLLIMTRAEFVSGYGCQVLFPAALTN
jgi:hypothetical protein